jgi:hypothetical protein
LAIPGRFLETPTRMDLRRREGNIHATGSKKAPFWPVPGRLPSRKGTPEEPPHLP